MVTSTRRTTMKNDAYEHVLINLMGFNSKSHTYKVLYDTCVTDIEGITSLTEAEISKLRAHELDDKGVIVERNKDLPIGHQSILRLMAQFLRKLQDDKGVNGG
jgi:hypothetical protein